MVDIRPQKKKSAIDYAIPVLIALFALVFVIHLSCSVDTAKKETAKKIANGESIENLEKSYGFSIARVAQLQSERMGAPTKNIYYNRYMLPFLGVSAFAGFVIVNYLKLSKKKYISGKEYGTAEWATSRTIAKLQSKYLYEEALKKAKSATDKEAVKEKYVEFERWHNKKKMWYKTDRIFTKTERICMFNYELNNNTLIIGGAGAGKSRGYVLPNLLQANTSNIVTDPKGELYGKVGYFLTKIKGHKLKILELGDFKHRSDCFNPLYYVHRDRDGWEERVLTLIETLISNTDGGQNQKSSDPFWDKAERLFLQAIIYAVVQEFPDEEVNFKTVNQLIKWLEIEEEKDNKDSKLDIFFEEFAKKYGDNNIAVQQFQEFRSKASGKTAKSIVISAVARLSPMKIAEIQRILSRDDMHLDMVGEEPTTIFVVKPPTVDECNFIAGMFFTILFQELNYCATVKHREQQRVPVPVHFYLDEFATTCRIPKFVEIQSYARSLGIGITVILQSLDQLKNIYEKEWGVVLDNSNTFLYLGNISSMETLKYVSELLGKGTFDKKSTSRTRGKSGSSSQNFDKIGRELMTPDEIKKLPKKECLLFVSGKSPFISEKYDYSMHPYYEYSADKNSKYFYEHTPQYLIDEADKKKKDEVILEEEASRKIVQAKLRDFDALVESELLHFKDAEQSVEELQALYKDMEFVDGCFKGSENVTKETVEGKTDEEISTILMQAERGNTKISINIAEIFKDELNINTTNEALTEIVEALSENKDDVVDVGLNEEIEEFSNCENSNCENEPQPGTQTNEVDTSDDEYMDEDEIDEFMEQNMALISHNQGTDLTDAIVNFQKENGNDEEAV